MRGVLTKKGIFLSAGICCFLYNASPAAAKDIRAVGEKPVSNDIQLKPKTNPKILLGA
ncbi:MAG: hypothetical protein MUP22_06830 [Desulfobacterales bacterium]|nr:hypothetical protein [Desulfobacterales bacterium]